MPLTPLENSQSERRLEKRERFLTGLTCFGFDVILLPAVPKIMDISKTVNQDVGYQYIKVSGKTSPMF